MRGPARFLVLGEAGLALAGLAWAWVRSLPLSFGLEPAAFGQAVLAAAGFSVGNLLLYSVLRRWGWPAGVHVFLEKEVFPLLRSLTLLDMGLLAFLAGAGEEILFRGVLQQEIGLWGASLAFGLVHGPTRSLSPLAVWASAMGVLLGILYQTSGNLVVPAVAHALYDGVALAYVRRMRT